MDIKITPLKNITDQHYELLLEADPNKQLIERYVQRAFRFEARDESDLVGILVLLPTRPDTLEVVNISVMAEFRNQGIGRQLLMFAEKYARSNHYVSLEIGTGTTSLAQLYLYQKSGFRVTGIDYDFFTIHYEKPIIENNLELRDMVRLRKVIK